jgi:AGZA family xanthine/uracil permease-like MFS transporter
MGLNGYFAYVAVPLVAEATGRSEDAWRVALGAVFLSGLLFVALSLVRGRERVVNAIPHSLKLAIAAGIGVFIAFMGLQKAGLVVDDPVTLLNLGEVRSATTLLALGGIVLTAAVMGRGRPGGLLLGIVAVALLAWWLGLAKPPEAVVSWPEMGTTLGRLDVRAALSLGFVNIVFVFFFVDLFDTVGTLVGVGEQIGLVTEDGKLPGAERAFLADGLATTVGAVAGTSTVTSYIESSAGVAVGARSGLSSLVVGFLFLLGMFLTPVVAAVPDLATVPALVVVGALMMASASKIPWSDITEGLPAFLVLVSIPLSFSIADGMAAGFVSYPLIKLLAGRGREVSPLLWVLAVASVLRYAAGA